MSISVPGSVEKGKCGVEHVKEQGGEGAMRRNELMTKLRALGDIMKEQRNKIVCSLIGHSRIITMCFGYVHCGRCEDQIGDALAGVFGTSDYVVVGHNCPTCRKNFKALTWRDKLFAANPFPKKAKKRKAA